MNEKLSECDSSFNQEDKYFNEEDCETNIQDYNEIIVEVVK